MNATITRTMLLAALGLAVTASAVSGAASYRTGWRLHATDGYGKPIVPSHHQGLEIGVQPRTAPDARRVERDLAEQAEAVRVDPHSQVKTLAGALARATHSLQRTAVRLASHGAAKNETNEAKALAALDTLDRSATRFDRTLAEPCSDVDRLREDFRLLVSAFRKAAYTQHYLGRWHRVDGELEAVTELIYDLRSAFALVDEEGPARGDGGEAHGQDARIGFRMPLPTWAWNHR